MEGNGFDCQDVNECEQNSSLPHNCSIQALCRNTNGSYFCQCKDGYQGDGFVCNDVDECELPAACNGNMTCSNVPGSYSCFCVLGRVYEEGTCVSEDTCVNASSNCHPLAKCHPYQGSFYCGCTDGYEGNGTDCWDVDECAQSQDQVCTAFSYCFNTNGSYICNCWEGFQDNGTHCQDIDECLTGNFTCPEPGSAVVPVKIALSSSWISTWKGERAVRCIHVSKLQGRATSGIRAQQTASPRLSQLNVPLQVA